MNHGGPGQAEYPPSTAVGTLPALAQLDGELDRRLSLACSLVGQPEGRWTQVTLVADADERAVSEFWDACNARVAELCNAYGVEVLLVEEGGQIRIRIERYRGPDQADAPREPVPPTGRRPRWPWLQRWRGRRAIAAVEGPLRQQETWSADAPGGRIDGR